jgi:glycosyltransferase involved in cell wall biosynthesis
MHIIHVTKIYYPDSFGGIEQVVRQITQSTAQAGVRHTIFTLSRHAAKQPSIQEGGVQIIRAPANFTIASTPLSFRALSLFWRLVKQADLVHYHFPWPYGDMLHLLCAAQKPAIVTYHSDIVRHRLLLPVYRPLMKAFLAKMSSIVATSPNYLRTSEILQAYRSKVVVIPIGLDETSYPVPSSTKIAYWRSSLGEDFFLFVGMLRCYKGLHILLDACVGTDFKVVIVGAGPTEQELRAQAQRLQLKNIYFLGAVSDEDKVALLKLCRAVVFPSHLRSEAFGITLLEGAMSSKPLVSSEIGTGSSYINVDNETGFVVPPSNPIEFRRAMQRLSDDVKLATRLGHHARVRFETIFSVQRMGQAYIELYSKQTQQF